MIFYGVLVSIWLLEVNNNMMGRGKKYRGWKRIKKIEVGTEKKLFLFIL